MVKRIDESRVPDPDPDHRLTWPTVLPQAATSTGWSSPHRESLSWEVEPGPIPVV